MKNLYTIIFFLLFHISIYGQRYHMDETTKPNDKLRYLKYDMSLVNGIVFCDYGDWGLYKDGKPTGLHKRWYKDGQLKVEVNVRDGKLDGLYTKWYWNGQLENKGNYKDGEKDGLHKYWYESGNRDMEVNYKDGKLDGLYRKWYLWNGQLESEENYKEGELISKKCWDQNGNQIECK